MRTRTETVRAAFLSALDAYEKAAAEDYGDAFFDEDECEAPTAHVCDYVRRGILSAKTAAAIRRHVAESGILAARGIAADYGAFRGLY